MSHLLYMMSVQPLWMWTELNSYSVDNRPHPDLVMFGCSGETSNRSYDTLAKSEAVHEAAEQNTQEGIWGSQDVITVKLESIDKV